MFKYVLWFGIFGHVTLLGAHVTYPLLKALLKMTSLFSSWDMLVPWRVFKIEDLLNLHWYAHFFHLVSQSEDTESIPESPIPPLIPSHGFAFDSSHCCFYYCSWKAGVVWRRTNLSKMPLQSVLSKFVESVDRNLKWLLGLLLGVFKQA